LSGAIFAVSILCVGLIFMQQARAKGRTETT
jgi:hypothetical protein